MDIKQYEENTRTWYLGAHYTARRTDDIELARELYEQRIQDLKWYCRLLE